MFAISDFVFTLPSVRAVIWHSGIYMHDDIRAIGPSACTRSRHYAICLLGPTGDPWIHLRGCFEDRELAWRRFRMAHPGVWLSGILSGECGCCLALARSWWFIRGGIAAYASNLDFEIMTISPDFDLGFRLFFDRRPKFLNRLF